MIAPQIYVNFINKILFFYHFFMYNGFRENFILLFFRLFYELYLPHVT